MLLLTLLGLCVLTVPLAGGRLTLLADLRPRALWSAVLALAGQVAIISVIPEDDSLVHAGVHVASYLSAGVFLLANRQIPGIWIVALGGALNLAAIVANGGVMPILPSAASAAGLVGTPGSFQNSAVLADPNLAFLGDVFALPAPLPLHNVFSVGDVCIGLGLVILLHRVCESRLVPSGRGQFAGLRQHRGFLRLWGAQGISDLGDWIYGLAVATSLAERGGTPESFALVLIFQFGPSALVGALGGPLIDRYSRKKLMIGADVLRALAVASLLVAAPPSTVHLYVVALLLGVFGALFMPSSQASLPNLVPEERLVAANALITTTFHVAVMAGPVIGALLVTRLGILPAFAINAGSFALSAALISGVRLPPGSSDETADKGTVRALKEGVRYILATPFVRGMLLALGFLMLAAGVRSPLEAPFVFTTLGESAQALGLVGAAWGIGMVLGSLGAPAVARRWSRERLFAASIALVGGAVLVASRQSSLPPVLFVWFLAGIGNGVGTVAYESVLQQRVPDSFRGRVMAAAGAILDGAFILGAGLAGLLGSQLGLRAGFMVSGGLFVGAALLTRVLVRPDRVAISEPVLLSPDDLLRVPSLTVSEAALVTGRKYRSILGRLEAGDFPNARRILGQAWLIPVTDLERAGFRLAQPFGSRERVGATA